MSAVFDGYMHSQILCFTLLRKLAERPGQVHTRCGMLNILLPLLDLSCRYDALISSWQFNFFDVDFGAGGPELYQGIVHPSPPWSAALTRAHPRHGGFWLAIVLPSSALPALRSSPVLKVLLPGAKLVEQPH